MFSAMLFIMNQIQIQVYNMYMRQWANIGNTVMSVEEEYRELALSLVDTPRELTDEIYVQLIRAYRRGVREGSGLGEQK